MKWPPSPHETHAAHVKCSCSCSHGPFRLVPAPVTAPGRERCTGCGKRYTVPYSVLAELRKEHRAVDHDHWVGARADPVLCLCCACACACARDVPVTVPVL